MFMDMNPDQTRKKSIESLGIKVLIYTNVQIQEEMDGVLQDILSNLPPTPSFVRRGSRSPASKAK
jgi:very-short-patch-repair endonuclease